MNSLEVRQLFKNFTGGTGSCKIERAPSRERTRLEFWTKSPPEDLNDRKERMIEAYFQVAARCGVIFAGGGIELDDGMYLIADRAVMNTAIDSQWVDFSNDVFKITLAGWQGIKPIGLSSE